METKKRQKSEATPRGSGETVIYPTSYPAYIKGRRKNMELIKLIALLLGFTLVMLFAVVACGDGGS
jgi:hypothetical protein